jgi:molybdopterin converting factor subunit 1
MEVRVLLFARLREIVETAQRGLELREGALVADAWDVLASERPALTEERGSTRAALNGRLVAFDAALAENDEVAFLPPVGGG